MHSRRIVVSTSCERRCPSCEACDPSLPAVSAEEVLAFSEGEIVLGGGDATSWPHLYEVLAGARRLEEPKKIWVEAPPRAFSPKVLERMAAGGAAGIWVNVEAAGGALTLALPGNRGCVGRAEALGLSVRVRLMAGAGSFSKVVPAARHLAPRPVTLELSRKAGGKRIRLSPRAVDAAFRRAHNLTFEHHRLSDRGYLPPCALPELYEARPEVWSTVLSKECASPNRVFDACGRCALSTRCLFRDAGALGGAARSRLEPPRARPPYLGGRRSPVPARIRDLRQGPEIACIAPWMVMEIVDPVGLMNHCCSDWTVGSRGNARVRSIEALWNGPLYRSARRRMMGLDEGPLCRPICPRLHDRRFAEHELQIIERSAPFVENQLLLAEDLAMRRDVVRAKPLYITLCPTTYCNYDCIMCSYGRLPRRDLPSEVLEQLDAFLPTLRTLTLLGGEPLASRAVMDLLRRFDRERYPDGGVDLVTNGSLLTERALQNLGGCAFGAVVISLNAGRPEDYLKIHRGVPMAAVIDNLDSLLKHRERYGHFGITLSFVVQPAASEGLVEFGEIALERGLDIRLLPLTPSSKELDFYGRPETVAKVLEDLDRFAEWARGKRPAWSAEIAASRQAIQDEAARRGVDGEACRAAGVLAADRLAE